MTEQSQTRTSKKFHRLSLKQTKSSLVWICVPVLFMGSQLEMKGLDPALISTLMIMTDPRLPTQERNVKGQYLVCCQWNWKSLSCVWLCDPMTTQSMEFSRAQYWSGWPFPSPGDLPNPGIKPRSPTLQTDSLPAWATREYLNFTFWLCCDLVGFYFPG